jgi:HAMP domain-containing protein
MTIRSRLLLLLLPPLNAFLILASFFFYFNWSREVLLLGSCLTLLLVIGIVFLIADRMSKPVRQLNQAALAIAAGDYEANIQVQGPKEIVELAHTLNTMSQCLVEHISRLRESSLIRERMYGEYECALLLQHYMLQKVIEDFHHPHMHLRLISVPLSPLQKGLSLRIDQPSNGDLTLTLLEAQEPGFAGLFQLNQWMYLPQNELKNKAFIECQFIDQYCLLRYHAHTLFPPLVWSIKAQQFIKSDQQEIHLQNRDMVFLYNSSLIEHFETEEAIEKWFAKVLRHFAEDGLDTIHVMLTNELTFLAKKQHVKHNFKIISLQIKINEPSI